MFESFHLKDYYSESQFCAFIIRSLFLKEGFFS